MPTMALSAVLLRVVTSVGDLYYIALLPIIALYVAIFLSNKLQTQQQRAEQQRQSSPASSPTAPHRTLHSLLPSSSLPSSSAPLPSTPLPPSPSLPSSTSSTLLSTSFPSSPSALTSAPSSPSSSSSSSSLPLQFLLPDQRLVSLTLPSPNLPVSSLISLLFPPPSTLPSSTRLIYQGRLMSPTHSLSFYSPNPHDIVHVHLLPSTPTAPTPVVAQPGPPAGLVAVLAVMMVGLGAGWGAWCTGAASGWGGGEGGMVLMGMTVVAGFGVAYAHATQPVVMVRE